MCRHCVSDCQPSSTEKLSERIIEDLVTQAAKLDSVRSIIFTGGETFLEYDTLVKSVALCEKLGLEASIVTNGFWASTSYDAKQKLTELGGLKFLNISTDSFHQEFVKVDRIRNVIQACYDLGIKCVVCISYLNDPVSEIKTIKRQLSGLEDLYITIAEPVLPFGRAAAMIDTRLFYAYNPIGMPCCGADSPLVEANGDAMVCCGGLSSHPGNGLLKVGNIYDETLKEIKKSIDLNPIVQTLRLRGPGGLAQLVRLQAEKEKHQLTKPPHIEETTDLCSLCKNVVADPNYAGILQRAVKDPKVYHEIAIMRLMEFGEVSMLHGKNGEI